MSNVDTGGANGAAGMDRMGEPTAGEAAPSPKEMITAATETVKQEVATFASSVKDKTKDQVEQRKDTATRTVGDFANAVRHAGDELAQHDQSAVGRVVKQAADGLEHLSRTVAEKRPEELLDAVRDFGRSNPTAFIAGSVLLGVALGRFARSSESHGQEPETSTYVQSQDFGPIGGSTAGIERASSASHTLDGGADGPGNAEQFGSEG
jgi:hypothetical protein